MICEGCIKQGVCKFRNEVERFEEIVGTVGTCKYRQERYSPPIFDPEPSPCPTPTWASDSTTGLGMTMIR